MDQELVQFLDSRFQVVNTQFQELRGEFQGLRGEFQELRGEFQGLRGEFQGLRGEMNERLEEVKRHSGVLVEGLRHELHLVAEGVMTHIDVRHAEDRAYVDQRFQDTNALVRLSLESTEQLRQRVENLERGRRREVPQCPAARR